MLLTAFKSLAASVHRHAEWVAAFGARGVRDNGGTSAAPQRHHTRTRHTHMRTHTPIPSVAWTRTRVCGCAGQHALMTRSSQTRRVEGETEDKSETGMAKERAKEEERRKSQTDAPASARNTCVHTLTAAWLAGKPRCHMRRERERESQERAYGKERERVRLCMCVFDCENTLNVYDVECGGRWAGVWVAEETSAECSSSRDVRARVRGTPHPPPLTPSLSRRS